MEEEIYKYPKELLITDPVNVSGIMKIEGFWDGVDIAGIIYRKKKVIVHDEIGSDRIHFQFEGKKTMTTREYFEKAREILKIWGSDDFEVMVSDKKDEPIILVSGNMGVILAPRVESED